MILKKCWSVFEKRGDLVLLDLEMLISFQLQQQQVIWTAFENAVNRLAAFLFSRPANKATHQLDQFHNIEGLRKGRIDIEGKLLNGLLVGEE